MPLRQWDFPGSFGAVPIASSGGVAPDLAFNDFNTTTSLDPFSLPFKYQYDPTFLDFPADPTGSGRGTICRFHYVGPSVPADVNLSITYVHDVTYGQTMYFKGQFYLPVLTATDKKLLYWQPAAQAMIDKYGAARTIFLVLGIWASGVLNLGGGNDDSSSIILQDFGAMSANTWYAVELRVTGQSAPGVADAVVQVWLDGVQIYSNAAVAFIPASWIGVPIPGGNATPLDAADVYWSHYQMGDQVNISADKDEYRYWDNCGFSTQRITSY